MKEKSDLKATELGDILRNLIQRVETLEDQNKLIKAFIDSKWDVIWGRPWPS